MLTKRLKNKKFIFWSAFLVFVIFVLNIFFLDKLLQYYYNNKIASYTNQIQNILNKDLEELSIYSQSIVDAKILNKYIKENDVDAIVKIIEQEQKKYNLKTIAVINRNGVVLSRSRFSSRTGDYILQNKPWGRLVAAGKIVNVIEVGSNVPLMMMSIVPIMENDEFIGAINVAKALDSEYANYLRTKTKKNLELIFYSRDSGLVGTTFDLENISENANFVASYFNTGQNISDPSTNAEMPAYLTLDQEHYRVSGLIFPGINESPGGIIIALPHNHLTLASIASAIFALCVYFIFYQYFDLRKKIFFKKNKKTHNHFISLILALCSLLIAISYFHKIFNEKYTEVSKPSFVLYNSILKIDPEESILDKNFYHRFAIKVEPGGEAINAVAAIINYDPQKIKVAEIIKANSLCRQDMFIEQSINNEIGQVRIACVLPDYKLKIKEAIVAELSVKAYTDGLFYLTFDKDSSVLAADGLGTNVLRMTIDGSYQIKDFKKPEGRLDPVLVFSPSHPNGNRWYKEKEITFSISPDEKYEYAYAFNQDPEFTPENFQTKIESYLNFKADEDGIYYFHIRSKIADSYSSTSHFKIMIDTSPPQFIEKNVSQTEIKSGEIIRLNFASQDQLSGIQSNYIKIDDNILLPVSSPVYIPFTKKGYHQIMLRSFDNANNSSDEYIQIKVKGSSMFDNIINIDFSSLF